MSTFECPYCGAMADYDGDYDGFEQDSDQEFECPTCEGEFVATVYWELVITNERKKETKSVLVDENS